VPVLIRENSEVNVFDIKFKFNSKTLSLAINRQTVFPAKLLEKGSGRDLYQTREGYRFWLDTTGYVDRCIAENGIFEPDGTRIINQLAKPGDTVLDVGANIGYYSVILSQLVGTEGRVICFEPTAWYQSVLERNLLENKVKNCEVIGYGLSNKSGDTTISIGRDSATIHWIGDSELKAQESIKLQRLDDIIDSLDVTSLDLVKVDVDGHEPAFLDGAWETIDRFDPVIYIEVSHPHYLDYGITAWDFYDKVKSKGMRVYSEKRLKEFESKLHFLKECGNFSVSANIILSKRPVDFSN